jgi:mitochondrial chaperone BCS1
MEETCVAGASCAAAFARVGLVHRALTIVLGLWTHVRRQLSNDFIGGSLALATASFLSNLTWRVGRHARRIAHDRVFTTYDIPSGTPQYHAALRWLHSQPAVQRASRRLVVNPAGARAAKNTGANDPDDPLELGLRTLPMLARDQSVCVRVGGALVWAGHGHVAAGAAGSAAAAAFDGHCVGLGAMGGGGARGSWYKQLLSGARGHAGLASSAQSGSFSSSHAKSFAPFARALDDGLGGLEGGVDAESLAADGARGGDALRLRVLSRDPRAAVKAVLAFGRELGRGTARRYTQVYMPSTAMSPAAAAMRAGAYERDTRGYTMSDAPLASDVSPARVGVDTFSNVHASSSYGARPEWVEAGRRPARPVASVVLKGDAARAIVDDARAFLRLERWYAERGIPYRRGYLLHGAPGSGKTSLVRAVAGELRLPVYQLPLSGAGVDDEAFHRLLNGTARRSVVLLEDVDAGVASPAWTVGDDRSVDQSWSRLTLRGVLGALDGVGAAEGRLLFMTCRDVRVLEPALIRPGRIDKRLAFGVPDKAQAKALFDHFYGFSFRRGLVPARGEEVDAETTGLGGEKAKTFSESESVSDETTEAWAEAFAAAATDPRLLSRDHPAVSSMAALQGLLMSHREDPRGAVKAAARILRDATETVVA